MKNRKQFAFNKLFNIFMIMGSFLLWIAYILITDNDVKAGIGFGVLGLSFVIVPIILTPYCYTFDSEGVSLHYIFFPVERYLWKNIHEIAISEDGGLRSNPIIDFLFFRIYEIYGTVEGEDRKYMAGHIRKSLRTKRLIEKYWDGTITSDIPSLFKKRKNKSNKRTYHTEEIAPMEREARAKLNELLTQFIARANQYNLELKKNYVYTTKDLEELNSRPKESYTYTLIVEISHPNETNEDRIVVVDVDLIYVRLGKNAYNGVPNKNAEKELVETMEDVLGEIYQNGIDVYCRNN